MDNNYLADIFIPYNFLNICISHFIVACYQIQHMYIRINCVLAYHSEKDGIHLSKRIFNVIGQIKQEMSLKTNTSWDIAIIGLIYNRDEKYVKKLINIIYKCAKNTMFIICINNDNSICLKELNIHGQEIDPKQARIILYSGYDMLSSQLLLNDENNRTMNEGDMCKTDSFIQFLAETCHLWLAHRKKFDFDKSLKEIKLIVSMENHEQYDIWFILISFLSGILTFILSKYQSAYDFFSRRSPMILKHALLLTTVGRQIHRRLFHLNEVSKALQVEEKLSLRTGNLILAIVFDLLSGWIVIYLMWHYLQPHLLLEIAMQYTNEVVNELQKLLYWLMGVPAGLKLNLPLNTALGHFFLYHIYLWKTYMTIVKPVFAFVLEMSVILGLFGLTFILSLIGDLISLATIHIYCFYGYAARLYGFQMASLAALWRLFRGKKWNPLRQRVDSYTYDVHQLYIGTLIFTILLFLLPTVMLYYFVFTVLRLVVLTVQGLISRSINLIGILPLYVTVLRVSNSKATTGDVYFSFYDQEEILVLTLEIVQIPLRYVIRKTLPKDTDYDQPLSWKMFLHSLIWGKIIYPI